MSGRLLLGCWFKVSLSWSCAFGRAPFPLPAAIAVRAWHARHDEADVRWPLAGRLKLFQPLEALGPVGTNYVDRTTARNAPLSQILNARREFV